MLRIGIIGLGVIADEHIRAYLNFPDQCEIVSLADVTEERADEKRARFGLESAAFHANVSDLLASGVDLVSICTPPASHAELTIAALDAGVDVIVEKPMARSLEECDAMLDAQRRSGRLLSVVAQNRFRDDMAALKAVLNSSLLGSLSHARIDSAWWRGSPYYDREWRGTWESEGGGPTLNHAIHHIDLSLWLLGRPDAVHAMLTNVQHDNSEVEDLSVATLRYGNALAQLTSSVVHHGEQQQIIIQGERARIAQPWSVSAEKSGPDGFPLAGGDADLVGRIEDLVASTALPKHHAHFGQIADVLDAITQSRPPAIDGHAGRAAVEVVTAIYKSGIEEKTVHLPLHRDDPYYTADTLLTRAPRFHKSSSIAANGGQDVR